MITGGYYIKAKRIQESNISHCAPCVREIWDLLLRKANYKPKKWNGITIQRGQLVITHKEIQELLHWKVGYRKMTYSEDVTKKAMKTLRSLSMIALTKAPTYTLITICNYDYYQDFKNYEGTSESTNESTSKAPVNPDTTPITKEDKELKEEKEGIYPFADFWDDYDKKRDKPLVEPLWAKLKDKEKMAIKEHIPKYKLETPDKKLRKDPVRYLRNRSWENEVITEGQTQLPFQSDTPEPNSKVSPPLIFVM